jgi:hypothetical protein
MFSHSSGPGPIFVSRFATNIKKNSAGGTGRRANKPVCHDYCIPIIFRKIHLKNKKDYRDNKAELILSLLESPDLNNRIENSNSSEMTQRIKEELQDEVASEYKNIYTRTLGGNKTYESTKMLQKIMTALNNHQPLPTQSGQKFTFWSISDLDSEETSVLNTVPTEKTSVLNTVPTEKTSVLERGDVVLLCALPKSEAAMSAQQQQKNVPRTTGREVFVSGNNLI